MPSRSLIFVILALAGCSGVRPPAVSVTGIEIAERGADAIALNCLLELTNPGTISIELDEMRYTVAVDGVEVYRGRHAAEATLSGGSTRRIAIPAVVESARLGGPAPASWSVSGSLWYKAPGDLAQLLVDMKVQRPNTPFRGEGVLPSAP